ncbi:MAG: hypothetical protein ACK5V0_13030 [Alphaproteobacteria bacterium]|jgi:hypothetical protein|nr:hypothetical protein [Rhizobiaceae bacterium]
MSTGPDPHRPYYRVDPKMDRYIPNQFSAGQLRSHVGLSLLLLGWGTFGLWTDDLVVPVSKRGAALHLQGAAALVMFCAMIAATLNLLSVILDHFDIRNNVLSYRRAAFFTQALGWLLFVAALLVHFLR